jgi:hypothetical protein
MTKEEIGKGWLLGPFYDLPPVSAMVGYGPGPHLSRRFLLKQATKFVPSMILRKVVSTRHSAVLIKLIFWTAILWRQLSDWWRDA